MQKEAAPAEPDTKKELALGKGKLPEEQAPQDKPKLKPPMLITPEVVYTLFCTSQSFSITRFLFSLLLFFCFKLNAHHIQNFKCTHFFSKFYLYTIFSSPPSANFVYHLCIHGIDTPQNNRMQRLKIKRQVFLLKLCIYLFNFNKFRQLKHFKRLCEHRCFLP